MRMEWFLILFGYVLVLPFVVGLAVSFICHRLSRGSSVRATATSWIVVLAIALGVESATTGALSHPEGYFVVVVLSLFSIPLGRRLAARGLAGGR